MAATVILGGALQSIDQAFTDAISGNTIWVKSATFPITGVLRATKHSGHALPSSLIGYETTRGDNGRPTLLTSAPGVSGVLVINGDNWMIRNFIIDGAGISASGVTIAAGKSYLHNIKVTRTQEHGIVNTPLGISTRIRYCETIACSGNSAQGAFHLQGGVALLERCVSRGNYQPAFALADHSSNPQMMLLQDFGLTSQGGNSGLYVESASLPVILHGLFYANSGAGITVNGSAGARHGLVMNTLLVGNASAGITSGSTVFNESWGSRLTKNAYYGNGAGQTLSTNEIDAVILSQDPFESATSGSITTSDFRLNEQTSGGILCRQVGEPGSFPALPNTVGVPDIGPVQIT